MNLGSVTTQLALQPAQDLPKDLEGTCRALEGQFTTLLFRKMREAMVPKSEGSSGFARETTLGLLEGQWAQLSSEGEGIGLWRTLLRQLETPAAAVKSEASGAEKKAMVALRQADFVGLRKSVTSASTEASFAKDGETR